jgi:uncharacterized membrane protein YeaQ/YmgE (transglycosylase-associated protein family)
MPGTVTITFDPLYVITWGIIGLVAGVFANWLMRGGTRLGSSLIIGLIGAIVGGSVFSLLNIQVGAPLNTVFPVRLIDIIVAFIGAIIILFIVDRVIRGRF